MTSSHSTYQRCLRLDLPAGQSAFLWGPRKTGKTTWLNAAFPGAVVYDFLQSDLFLRMAKEPWRLREELLALPDERVRAQPIVLDEVQRVPEILNEVHGLIERRKWRFVLCGSSARRLRRGQANLLGGRAWRFEMHPLTWRETGIPNLVEALRSGLLPPHLGHVQAVRSLKAYVEDYLTQEVMAEGLVRNLPAFARFLDAVGYSHGGLINYSGFARECGVDAKTVRAYFDILEDTLVGQRLPPFHSRGRRQLITEAEKFYLFDVGVAGQLCRRTIPEARGDAFGRAFEHLVWMELRAHRSYTGMDYELRYWRTKQGHEVDFVLGDGQVAVEVKGAQRVDSASLHSLAAFAEEYRLRSALVVCDEPRARRVGRIEVLPWRVFFERLWAGEVVR